MRLDELSSVHAMSELGLGRVADITRVESVAASYSMMSSKTYEVVMPPTQLSPSHWVHRKSWARPPKQ